jgi:predicted metal-dependent phosphoesterase TrpH
VDYVETYNARAYRDANPLAGAFARRHELPGLASSDAHSVMEIGIASTILPAAFSTSAGLKELLPRATLMMGRASYYVRLWTPLAKIVQRARGNGRVPQEHASGSNGNGA